MSVSFDRISVPRPFETPSLALGPVEAFVLSKIDGRRTLGDLAALVGLAQPELEAIVGRLAAQGVITIDTLAIDEDWDTQTDRESSRPTTPSSDDPFAQFDRATSPGEAPDEVLRAAGGSTQRRRPVAD